MLALLPTWGRAASEEEKNASAASPPDPLPLRRVLITPDLLPAEVARAPKGALIQLSREEFEDKLKRARQASAARPAPPRLVESRYRAFLFQEALIGTAQWRALNPSSHRAILPLQPFNLAVRKARIEKGDADAAEALLGDLDGKALGLLLEQAGEQTAQIDWTARGIPFPGGLRYELRLPPAAVSSLELTLPADRILDPHDNYLLSGPLPAEQADRRLWHVDCAGQSQLELVIRQQPGPGQVPLLLARVETRQDLEPDRVRADFDVHLEVLHQGVRELRFACDPELIPYEVASPQVQSWEHRPAARPEERSLLLVRLHETQRDCLFSVHLRCLAPLRARPRWTSPAVRVQGAVPRGETLVLRIHPDLRLEDWKPGAFEFNAAAVQPAGTSDTWPTLSLTHTALVPGNPRARPSARVPLQGPQFRCRQTTWWQVGRDTSSLTAEIDYEITQGQLFRLPVELPPEWDVERVELTPAQLLRAWSVTQEPQRALLNLELQHPLAAGNPAHASARLLVKLIFPSSRSVKPVNQTLSFPDLLPRGPELREGTFALTLDPQWEGTLTTGASPLSTAEPGPWGEAPPDYAYRFHGLRVTGTLRLNPRRTPLRARCRTEVMLAPERAAVMTRLVLRSQAGDSNTVDLALSGPTSGRWEWKTERGPNEVRSCQRLQVREAAPILGLVGMSSPLSLAMACAAQPRQEIWRLTLAQPLREWVVLRGTVGFEAAGPDSKRRWNVPLPSVLGTDAVNGEIKLHLTGIEDAQYRSVGLAELTAAPDPSRPLPWRSFRYEHFLPSLELRGTSTDRGEVVQPRGQLAAEALLLAEIAPHRVLCRFQCRLRAWMQPSLPIRLPTQARCLAATLDGHRLPIGDSSKQADGHELLQLPFLTETVPHILELLYELPVSAGTLWTHLDVPAPELPVQLPSLRRVWRLPSGTVPLAQERMTRPTDAALNQNSGLNYSAWEPVAGAGEESSLVLIQHEPIVAAGWALALLGSYLCWLLRARLDRVGRAMLLCWLAYGGLGTLWLPRALQPLAWYPALAGLTVAALLHGRPQRSQPARIVAAVVCWIAVALAAEVSGIADTPAPYTVYLLARNADTLDWRSVLAPAQLLDQLDELTRPGPAGLQSAALLGADYEGRSDAERAEFRARYRVHAFAAENATVTIPLGGVQLRSARCDGADIHPVAVRGPREGYSFQLRGAGNHEIVLEFSVPVHEQGGQREAHCTIPELAQSRLRFRVPAGRRALHAFAARGAQRVRPNVGLREPADRPLELESDLGALAHLQIRWRQDGLQPRPAALQVSEAYLWELHPSLSDLHAVLQYTVADGATDSLRMHLPEPLLVRRIEAARLPGASADEPPPRLRDWRIHGSQNERTLEVEFHRPIHTGVQLHLELLPRTPFGLTPTLPLPTPQQARFNLAYLAYRAENARAVPLQHLRLNGDSEDGFAGFWKTAGLEEAGPDVHAFWFGRAAGSPVLQLQLESAASGLEHVEVDTWKVGPRQANLTSVAQLTAAQRTFQFVEWNVAAALAGVEVSGPEVRTWSRTGGRVQVWLQRPCDRAELKLTAWQPLPASQENKESVSLFNLPALGIRGRRPQRHVVQVAAAEGASLELGQVQNLTRLPNEGAADGAYQFTGGPGVAAGTFRVLPAQARTEVDVLSFCEFRDRQLAYFAAFDCRAAAGSTSQLTVHVRNWPGGPLQWEAAGATVRPLASADADHQAWKIVLPGGSQHDHRLRLLGRWAPDRRANLVMPEIAVEGAARVRQWVAVAGRELGAEAQRGLSPVADATQALRAWPAEADRIRRIGAAWAIGGDDAQLRLLPKVLLPGAAPVQVLLADRVDRVEGRQWRHAMTYRIFQDTSTDLTISLPEGAAVQAASIDGNDVPLIINTGRLWLPLGPAGLRTVRLEWTFAQAFETLETPNLTPPQFEGETVETMLYTVYVPAGYRAELYSPALPATAALLHFQRAQMQVDLSVRLAELDRTQATRQVGQPIRAAQTDFYHLTRQVDHALTDQPALAERLQELKERNRRLAETHGFESIQQEAEQQAGLVPPSSAESQQRSGTADDARGTPIHWLVGSESSTPSLRLVSLQSVVARRHLGDTVLWLGLLAVAGVLWLSPSSARLGFAWPEWLVLAALIGWFSLQPSPFFILLGLIGAAIRVSTILFALTKMGRQWRTGGTGRAAV
jgi:hypothetical protein